jgi:hypothetical protein
MKLTRRVVTGHNTDGRSVVISDGPVSSVGSDLGQIIAWATDTVPAAAARPEDVDSGDALHEPPRTGVKIFYVEIPPDGGSLTHTEKEAIAREMFAALGKGFVQVDTSRHPFMHMTPTIDCVIILTGEVSLLVDEGDPVPLQPFDIVVQQGTNHAWVNTGTEPALFVAIMAAKNP